MLGCCCPLVPPALREFPLRTGPPQCTLAFGSSIYTASSSIKLLLLQQLLLLLVVVVLLLTFTLLYYFY